MPLKGNDLNLRIEQELQLMLAQGFEQSPISSKSLHSRLVESEIIKGGLSTLSTPKRKLLINHYKNLQLEKMDASQPVKDDFAKNRTRSAYKKQYDQQVKINQELRTQLDKNTEVLIDIVKEISSKTPVKIEALLSEHLVVELHKESSKPKKLEI